MAPGRSASRRTDDTSIRFDFSVESRSRTNDTGGSSLANGADNTVLAASSAAHVAKTTAGLPIASNAAANSGPTRTAAFSQYPINTLAAVSCSGALTSPGIATEYDGRMKVTSVVVAAIGTTTTIRGASRRAVHAAATRHRVWISYTRPTKRLGRCPSAFAPASGAIHAAGTTRAIETMPAAAAPP